MDVLESSQYLIQEVAHMVVTKLLRFQQFVHVSLHQTLYNITVNSQLRALPLTATSHSELHQINL